ncbi:MAG TPA: histidine--tRNA ligase, partial [Dehalococcoidia bacterium]|nr:histidine--tRNA ligase [Dehalococcoidia bacterium]
MNRQPTQSTETVSRLQGMTDLSEESWRSKQELQERLRQLLGEYGYRLLETPVLESTELFLRKSGGEL